MGPKPLHSPSSPSKVVTMAPKALSWHLSPLHHQEPDWDSFLLPVLFLEPDWDSFVVPMVISELDWDSYVQPVVISELDTDWDLFGLLVYRQIVSQRPIVFTTCSNRSMCVRHIRVPLLRHLQGSRGRGLPILARLDRP